MKKFILKLSIFLLITFSIIGPVNKKYKETNHYRYQNSSYKFYQVPKEIEIGNLGTSHGFYALNYEDVDEVAFNFALPAQRIHYDLKLFEKYLENFKEDSTLILPISYISLYLGYDNDNFEEFNKVYYKLLPARDIVKFNVDDYTRFGLLPILTAESNIKYIFEEEYKEPPKDYYNYTIDLDAMIEDGINTSNRHKVFIEEGEKNLEDFIGILEDIIVLAQKNNIDPVLVAPPYTKYYNEHFSKDFREDFYGILQEMAGKYDLSFYDYSEDPRFYEESKYFFDASHLNYTGGKYFTDILLKDIKNDKI